MATYGQMAARYRRAKEKWQEILNNLDADYKTLLECKQLLATASAHLGDISTQCADTCEIYDRNRIESKYDALKVSFNGKDMIFSYLDKIKETAKAFDSSCLDTKTIIDNFGPSLDDACKEIAEKALEASYQYDIYAEKYKWYSMYDPNEEIQDY